MFVTDANITSFNKYLATTNGREKIYRLIQYFSRFYAFYLLRQGAPAKAIQRWSNLQNYLGTARKVFRFFKPIEVGQGVIKSLAIKDPILRILQLARLASYFAYFTSETLSLADGFHFYKLKDSRRVLIFGVKCWSAAIVSSILLSFAKLWRISARAHKLGSLGGKEAKIESNKLIKDQKDISYQLIQDAVDLAIPSGVLKWIDLDDGVIGLAGVITSLMGMKIQWEVTNHV